MRHFYRVAMVSGIVLAGIGLLWASQTSVTWQAVHDDSLAGIWAGGVGCADDCEATKACDTGRHCANLSQQNCNGYQKTGKGATDYACSGGDCKTCTLHDGAGGECYVLENCYWSTDGCAVGYDKTTTKATTCESTT